MLNSSAGAGGGAAAAGLGAGGGACCCADTQRVHGDNSRTAIAAMLSVSDSRRSGFSRTVTHGPDVRMDNC